MTDDNNKITSYADYLRATISYILLSIMGLGSLCLYILTGYADYMTDVTIVAVLFSSLVVLARAAAVKDAYSLAKFRADLGFYL